jgi:hypothetical protein
MSWDRTMVTITRGIIDDLDSDNYTYTDSRLQQLLVIAAHYVTLNVTFNQTYTINIDSPDITPDPTVAPKDQGFVNLTVLKAACILAKGEYRKDSSKGMVIKDGPSSIDARTLVQSKKDLMTDMCEAYAEAELQYRLGNSKAGEAIVGPHLTNRSSGGSNRDRPEFS